MTATPNPYQKRRAPEPADERRCRKTQWNTTDDRNTGIIGKATASRSKRLGAGKLKPLATTLSTNRVVWKYIASVLRHQLAKQKGTRLEFTFRHVR